MGYRGAVALVAAPLVVAGFGLIAIVAGHGTTGIALLIASLVLRMAVRLSGRWLDRLTEDSKPS